MDVGSFGRVFRCINKDNLAIKEIHVNIYKKKDKDIIKYL